MISREHKLNIRAVDRAIFMAIKTGRKKIDTRAATVKLCKIKTNDTVVFVCGREKLKRKVKSARLFKSIAALLRCYRARQINPAISSAKELTKMYYSFPNYKEKIKKFGLIALKLN